jgi:hypothetical protein
MERERAVVLAIDRFASSALHGDKRAILLELSVRAVSRVDARADACLRLPCHVAPRLACLPRRPPTAQSSVPLLLQSPPPGLGALAVSLQRGVIFPVLRGGGGGAEREELLQLCLFLHLQLLPASAVTAAAAAGSSRGGIDEASLVSAALRDGGGAVVAALLACLSAASPAVRVQAVAALTALVRVAPADACAALLDMGGAGDTTRERGGGGGDES